MPSIATTSYSDRKSSNDGPPSYVPPPCRACMHPYAQANILLYVARLTTVNDPRAGF